MVRVPKMKGYDFLKLPYKKLITLFLAIVMIVAAIPFQFIAAATTNSVSLTLYNDSVIPEGENAPVPNTSSYTWKMTDNTSNVFRLVIDMSFAKLYQANEVELTVNAFSSAGRNTPIIRKSFGNETGVFKETKSETVNSGIVAVNTAAINGSASVSITYQIKPEEIKDLGTINKPLALNCTLKAGNETVTSNTISFTTDFTQSWSIINSGDHDEAYDEIEVYQVNEYAPLIHKERLKTIDGIFVDATTVSQSNYQWIEYRVPLLSDDPLGIYNHFIEVYVPDGCIFYSAQSDNEDRQITPCVDLKYTVNTENNLVSVNCADFINAPHSADETDSYYYFVIALDKSKYNNTNVITFKEKHVHKDDNSIVKYSDNVETIDVEIGDVEKYTPSTTDLFNVGVAKEDFLNNYQRETTAVPFSLPVTSEMKVSSTVPYVFKNINFISLTKTNLSNDEFRISAVNIPAHYLNDNGEVVYGIDYTLYVSGDGNTYAPYQSGSITEDITIKLQNRFNYAYVVYSPTDKSSSTNFFTYGAGSYSYRVSPTFVYEFSVGNSVYEKMENDSVKYVSISSSAENKDNPDISSSITNFIPIEDIVKQYRLRASESEVQISGNHYDVTTDFVLEFNSNTSQKIFSNLNLVSVIPSNYYGHSADSVATVLNKVKESVVLSQYSSNGKELVPLTLYKYNTDGSVESKTVTTQNVKEYVSVSVEEKGDNLKIYLSINFGEYSTLHEGKTKSFVLSYTWPMSRLEESELGEKKTFDMISALYAVNEENAVPAPSNSDLPSGTYYGPAKDDGSFVEKVSSVSILKEVLSDADNDNNTEETAYFAQNTISVLDTGETAQSTSIAVQTEYTPFTASTYAKPAITRSDKEYTLRFSFEGYSSSYSDLVFVTNLGNSSDDLSDWLGTFKSIGSVNANFTSVLSSQIYYQTDVVDINSEMESIKGGTLLEGSNKNWKLLDKNTDRSTVKAIAVKISASPIVKEDVVTVDIKMQSNSDYAYNNLYNRVKFGCVAVPLSNNNLSVSTSDYVVIKQLNPKVTYVKRIKADDVNVANGVPTFIVECGSEEAGTSFVFSFDEGYSTVEINGVKYYELSHEITTEFDFGKYSSKEKDSLRYGNPHLEISSEDGTVSVGNIVDFETSFENPEVTIISTSEKIIHNKLSHTYLCVNEFEHTVKDSIFKNPQISITVKTTTDTGMQQSQFAVDISSGDVIDEDFIYSCIESKTGYGKNDVVIESGDYTSFAENGMTYYFYVKVVSTQ